MASLVYTVHLTDEDGRACAFGPGDDVPDWARKRITNPLAWDAEPAGEVAANATGVKRGRRSAPRPDTDD